MVHVRFIRGQWGNPGPGLNVKASDRPAVKAAIEAHLTKRFERVHQDASYLVHRRYRVPQSLFLRHCAAVRFPEYFVTRELQGPIVDSRSEGSDACMGETRGLELFPHALGRASAQPAISCIG